MCRSAGEGLDQEGDTPIDLVDGLRQLRAAAVMRGGRPLPLELRAREAQRLEGAPQLGIPRVVRPRLHFLAREIFHAFLNARFLIDESFAGISHILTL